MTGGPRTRWSLPRWVVAAVAAGAAGALPAPVWLRRPLAPRQAYEVVVHHGVLTHTGTYRARRRCFWNHHHHTP